MRQEITMSLPAVTSPQEWLTARKDLLRKEKEFTKLRDALNTSRRELPMVRVDKEYVFEGPDGKVSLADMFGTSRQLILQHVMYDPQWDDACPSCTAGLDEMSPGLLRNLRSRDTAFAAVSRAPHDKIAAYKERKGWDFPWYSSFGSDFNYDFHVTLDDSVTPFEYNFRTAEEFRRLGQAEFVEGEQPFEMPGTSFFLRDGDTVFHTNSTYARGAEMTGGSYYFLDLTALGRQEDWEEPKGRADRERDATPNFSA
jgi:predicted dithiol-disulfide oxidoreductase (DUF899 family)